MVRYETNKTPQELADHLGLSLEWVEANAEIVPLAQERIDKMEKNHEEARVHIENEKKVQAIIDKQKENKAKKSTKEDKSAYDTK